MIGVVDVKTGKDRSSSLNDRYDTLDEENCVERQSRIHKLAYIDVRDEEALAITHELYERMSMRVPTDAVEKNVVRLLMEINFAEIDRLAQEAGKTHSYDRTGKPKWSDKECAQFLDEYLLPALIERFIIVGERIYFKTMWGYWHNVGSRDVTKKLVTIAVLMVETLELTTTSRLVSSFSMAFDTFATRSAINANAIIQFNDCQITENCVVTQEPPSAFPRFIFDFDAWDAITSKDAIPEVDDLLLHLANGDKEVMQCLVDRLSMVFVTSVPNKLKLDPKAIMLYGPTGKNGKSTLAKLLMRALRNRNCKSFPFSDFCGYEAASVRDNLLLIDSDASSVHVSPDVSTTLKLAITADTMTVRQIYQKPESVTPLCQFLICTNAMPKSDDKTRGWDRRLEWFEVKEKLLRDETWFDVIGSQAAADYLLGKLIRNAAKLVAKGEPIHVPDVILNSNDVYSDSNKNVCAWIACELKRRKKKDAKDAFDRMPSAKLHADYETWCEENAETPLGITKFNQIFSAETGLVKRFGQIRADRNPEAFEWWQANTKSEDRLTATKASVMCWTREG